MKVSPAAHDLLPAGQIAALRERSDAWGVGLVAHAWGVIALAIFLATRFPGVVTITLAVLAIGSRQLGLVILMHDAAHGMLARTPWLNRLLGQALCAWPMLADAWMYRRYHLQHHANTQQAGDPDLALTGQYPISRRSLYRKFLRDLSGRTGFAQRAAQFRAAFGPTTLAPGGRLVHFAGVLGPQCAANVVLCGLFTAFGHWYSYALFWVLPLLTWHQLVLRIRNIAEHACVSPGDSFGNARTTLANWLERVFIAPYWVNYHLEHHLLMWVPCHRLPLLHRMLREQGHGERMRVRRGYRAVLAEVTTAGEEGDGPRKARAVGTFSGGYEVG